MSGGQTKPSRSTPATHLTSEPSDLHRALAACSHSFPTTAFFSLFINLLMFVPAIYMLAIYDRVLMSGSEPTLMMLTVITVFLFLVLGALEWIRARLLVATSARLDEQLGERVFDAIFAQSLTSSGAVATAQPLNDLLQIWQFLTGPGMLAFFDAPWIPIYVVGGQKRYRESVCYERNHLCRDGGDASPMMREGPSMSAYRRRLQTAASGVD